MSKNHFYKVTFVTFTFDKNAKSIEAKTNKHVKYESPVINSSQDNEGTSLFRKVILLNLTFGLITSIVHGSIKTNQHVNYESYVINCS